MVMVKDGRARLVGLMDGHQEIVASSVTAGLDVDHRWFAVSVPRPAVFYPDGDLKLKVTPDP